MYWAVHWLAQPWGASAIGSPGHGLDRPGSGKAVGWIGGVLDLDLARHGHE